MITLTSKCLFSYSPMHIQFTDLPQSTTKSYMPHQKNQTIIMFTSTIIMFTSFHHQKKHKKPPFNHHSTIIHHHIQPPLTKTTMKNHHSPFNHHRIGSPSVVAAVQAQGTILPGPGNRGQRLTVRALGTAAKKMGRIF